MTWAAGRRGRKGDGRSGRRTKIVATLGPASSSVEIISELLFAGADIFRLNFSHGTEADHEATVANVREAELRTGLQVGVLGDLPGPEIRLGEIRGGSIELRHGATVDLTEDDVIGTDGCLGVSLPGLTSVLRPGSVVFLADGRIRLGVRERRESAVRCEVEVAGSVSSRQGVNAPGAPIAVPAVGAADLALVDFAVRQGIALLAVSFVAGAADLLPVAARLQASGSDIPLIAKVERAEAAERVEEIVAATTGGVMVARGDLGIEIPIERVPAVQRELIATAGRLARPSVTATQMLASMVDSPRPTRAEVSDVAAAIHQGSDAVMLSEETAIGRYPVEAVAVMDRVARATEPVLPYEDWQRSRVAIDPGDVAGSVARAAVAATRLLGLKALVVPTTSGRTARLVAAHRPTVPVLAVTPRQETVRRLRLLFGVDCVLARGWGDVDELVGVCSGIAGERRVAASGDLIGIAAGLPGHQLGTNMFEILRVP